MVDCFVLFALEELLTCEAHGWFLEPSWVIHIQTTRLSHISNLSKPDKLAVNFAFFSFKIFQGIKSSERHVSCVYVNPEAFQNIFENLSHFKQKCIFFLPLSTQLFK